MRPRSLLFLAKCLLFGPINKTQGAPANLVVSVIILVPAHKLTDAVRKRRSGREPRDPRQPVDVGEGGRDVARLHRQVAPLELTTHRGLDRRDELGKLNGRMI